MGVDAPQWEKLEKGILVPFILGLAPSKPHIVLLSTTTLLRFLCGVFLGHTCSLLLCEACLAATLPSQALPSGRLGLLIWCQLSQQILLTPALHVNYILVKLIKKKIFSLKGSNLMTSCKLRGFLSGFLAMVQAPNSITGQGVLWFGCYHTAQKIIRQ